MRNQGKRVVTAAIGAAILAGVWAAGPPLTDEYLPSPNFGTLEPGPVVLEPEEDDLYVPGDPNCWVQPNVLGLPWQNVERAACREALRDGTRVLAYAVARAVYQRGWGSAFAVAREADGTISLYRVQGGPDAIREAYFLAVGDLYMRAVDPWQVIARASALDELLTWMQHDISGVGREALALFNGGPEAWGRQYISWPDDCDNPNGEEGGSWP